ncbi:hypothetical protein E2C01_000016 [Portunus trituberculatus]|uniref:Uncharacterized protein n=1 Tax=Portunus trituberculatus TaxID=210409 RepID=A0A5B7CF76_PORTR|nr:hypothetical protein [Portunus trituberculatus]
MRTKDKWRNGTGKLDLIRSQRKRTYPWSEEKLNAFVEKSLIGTVTQTEILEKLVRQLNQLIHALVLFVISLSDSIPCEATWIFIRFLFEDGEETADAVIQTHIKDELYKKAKNLMSSKLNMKINHIIASKTPFKIIVVLDFFFGLARCGPMHRVVPRARVVTTAPMSSRLLITPPLAVR